MTLLKKTFSVLFSIIFVLSSCIGFLDEDNIIYIYLGGGSTGMETLVTYNVWGQIILLVIFFSIFILVKKNKTIKIILLSLVFIVWLMSERVISIGLFPDTRINCGWIYHKTESINLSSELKDPEQVFLETSFEKLSFWRIKIKNDDVDKIIFVGPFIWNKTIILFDKFNMRNVSNNVVAGFPCSYRRPVCVCCSKTRTRSPRQQGASKGLYQYTPWESAAKKWLNITSGASLKRKIYPH